jgi:plasmid stabilization system protein ParE
MLFHVIVTKEAHHDVLEAFRYYEEKQIGLGERFLGVLEDCYLSLSKHPEHYGFIDEDPLKVFRDVKLEKFPYVVVFEIRKAEVVVYAVHNTYKHPANKLRKS